MSVDSKRKWVVNHDGGTAVVIVCMIGLIASMSGIGQGEQTLDDLFGVSFPSAEQGWICGRWGAMFHTSDGGKTWERQGSGTDLTLSALFFPDAQNGWAVGDDGTILHTSDGGTTWVKQQSPVSYFLLDVHFADAQKGWIVTERTTILVTRDSGATWEVQFKDQDFVLKGISFCDARNGWAVGEYGFIYHTSDGGATWEQQAGEFGFSEETGEIEGGTYLFDVVALDPQNAWAVGMDGYVVRTVDGGKTWERIAAEIPVTHLFGVAANKKGGFLICGSGIVLVSSDGGQSFMAVENDPVIMYGWLNGATADSAGRLSAVGKEGWIYTTADYGRSWDKRTVQEATQRVGKEER